MGPSLKRCCYNKKRSKPKKKEEISEDWCFECKDGGDLILCEFKHCLKAYHPKCADKPAEFANSEESFICGWHTCTWCSKKSKFQCFNCPCAVCKNCLSTTRFVHVRGQKGFCEECLKLICLVEKIEDFSGGQKVDFKEEETIDFLFQEYWDIVKEEEGITLTDLQSAVSLYDKNKNYVSDSDEFAEYEEEDQSLTSDSDDNIHTKRKLRLDFIMERSNERRKVNPKKKEFGEWGSKCLTDFLESIGKDTSKPFSQDEVYNIIMGYINENKLHHPEKRKKRVLCDPQLRLVFQKQSFKRNKMNELLESHFLVNQVVSEEEDIGCYPEEFEDPVSRSYKRPRKTSSDGIIIPKKNKVLETPKSCFAAIIVQNIKLVYLKRSLIEDLLKTPGTFDDKLMWSFVRIKSDPNDYFQKNPYQLVQVIGITNVSRPGDTCTKVILHVSAMNKDVHVKMLCDDDFSEEECEDLRLRMKGQLKKLTVVELEQKSRVLHEDITKHWILRELVKLQSQIDRANEKGWRRELGEYLEKRQLLKTPAEQQRLLQEVPKVVAEEMEIEVTIFEPPNDENEKHGDDYSPRSIILTSSEVLDESAEKRTQSIVQAITHPAGTGLSTDAIATSQIVMSYLAGEDQNEDVNEIVAKKDEDIEAVILVSGQDELGVQIDILHEASRSTVSNVSGIGHFTKEVATSEVVIFDLAGEDMNGDEVDEKSAKKEGSRVTVSNVSGIGHFTNDVATSEVVIFDLAGEDMNGDVVGEKSAKKEGSRGTVSNVLGIGHFTKEIAASEVAIIDLAGEDMNGDEVDEKSAKKEVSDKNVEKQLIAKGRVSAIEVIDLDDDEEDEEVEDLNARIWHYVDPEGNTQGPFQMSALKKWKDSNYFPDPEFKVWKTGKTQEKSILLTDALHMVYQK